ncbi:Holliday junction resolvase [Candidatus Woesearchaeota archaeon]|nr:Holliday junction resolvase [Candidatus Woesearchaeota archaeon]
MKKKGTRAERELIHLFHNNNWGVIRSAGSGSTPLPSSDILVSNKKKLLAIECKFIKHIKKYLYPDEIKQLKEFAEKFNAEPLFAIKFQNKGWYFIRPEELNTSKNGNYNLSLEEAKKKGATFQKLIEVN